MCSTRHAFTLIELLVVVSLLVLLIAMLLPALGRARDHGRTVACFSNESQIHNACVSYASDHLSKYPAYDTWSTLLGKLGTHGAYQSNSYGIDRRPLNVYVHYEVARCPSDIGDGHVAYAGTVTNCYEQFGNSYQSPWNYDVFRTVFVFGAPGIPAKRVNSFSHPSNKVVIGDFGWWQNRLWSNPLTRWHDKGDERNVPIAFADGHCDWLRVPAEYEWEGATGGNVFPPDPGFIWW